MKIAVVHNLPAGGAKRVLCEQVKRLTKRHQVDVYTFFSSDDSIFPLKKVAEKYITVEYNYPPHFPKSVFSVYWNLKKAYRKMAEIINSQNYDVAYVAPCYLTQSPYVLRYLKIPAAYFCPEPRREFYEKIPRVSNRASYAVTFPFRLFIKKIDYDNIHLADLIITLSQYNKTNIKRIYGLDSRIVKLGVDTNCFKPVNVKKENMLLSVGNFTLLKGHDFAIRSVSMIPAGIRPKLLIAGFGGSEKNYLIALAGRLNVNLDCIDSPDDNELNILYNRARLFVFTPLKEPFGLVVLEAWACGLKLLAVRDGGVPELVSQDFLGSLTKRRENLFSQEIVGEISKKDDPKTLMLRRQYVVKNWNWDNSVAELERLLYKLIKKN